MTIPAYPKRQFSTLNVLAIVIIIFNVFDDLTHSKKNTVPIIYFPALLYDFYENLPKK